MGARMLGLGTWGWRTFYFMSSSVLVSHFSTDKKTRQWQFTASLRFFSLCFSILSLELCPSLRLSHLSFSLSLQLSLAPSFPPPLKFSQSTERTPHFKDPEKAPLSTPFIKIQKNTANYLLSSFFHPVLPLALDLRPFVEELAFEQNKSLQRLEISTKHPLILAI